MRTRQNAAHKSRRVPTAGTPRYSIRGPKRRGPATHNGGWSALPCYAGGEEKGGGTPAIAAGLKPRPSGAPANGLALVRNPDQLPFGEHPAAAAAEPFLDQSPATANGSPGQELIYFHSQFLEWVFPCGSTSNSNTAAQEFNRASLGVEVVK